MIKNKLGAITIEWLVVVAIIVFFVSLFIPSILDAGEDGYLIIIEGNKELVYQESSEGTGVFVDPNSGESIHKDTSDDGTVEAPDYTSPDLDDGLAHVDDVFFPVTEMTLDVGDTYLIEYSLTSTIPGTEIANQGVTWSSSDTSVATIHQDGTITAISPGSSVITISTHDNNKTAYFYVTVNPIAVTDILVDVEQIVLPAYATYQLSVSVLPTNATNQQCTFSIENEDLATVDNSGLITAKNSSMDNYTTYVIIRNGSAEERIELIIEGTMIPTEDIVLDKTTYTVQKGGTLQINASVSPSDATSQTITYQSVDTYYATIDGTGLVTGQNIGSTYIYVCNNGGNFYGEEVCRTATIEVIEATYPLESITLKYSATSVESGTVLSPTITYNPTYTTNKQLTWTTSDSDVISVDAYGVITANKNGTATVTATSISNPGVTASVTFTVTGYKTPVEEICFNETDVELYVGETTQLTTTILPEDATVQTVTYTVSDTALASIASDGTLTALSSGIVVVTATAVDNGLTASIAVVIKDIEVTSIEWNVTADEYGTKQVTIYTGEEMAVGVTIKPDNATDKEFTVTSLNEEYATYEDGMITTYTAGETIFMVNGANGSYDILYVSVKDKGPESVETETTLYLTEGESTELIYSILPEDIDDRTGITSITSNSTTVTTVEYVESCSQDALTGEMICDITKEYVTTYENIISLEDNVITALHEGSAQITIYAAADMSVYEVVTVVVSPIISESLILNSDNPMIFTELGVSEYIDIEISPDNATNKEIWFAGMGDGIVSVSETGKVTTLAYGATYIYVLAMDTAIYDSETGSLDIENSPHVLIEVQVIDENVYAESLETEDDLEFSLLVAEQKELTVEILPEDTTDQSLRWVSSDSTIAVVNNGVVTGISAGVVYITAYHDDGLSLSYIVTVRNQELTDLNITPSEMELSLNESGTYEITTTPVSIVDDFYYVTITDSEGNESTGVSVDMETNTITALEYGEFYVKFNSYDLVDSISEDSNQVIKVIVEEFPPDVWDGETETEPENEDNYYIIYHASDLAWICSNMNEVAGAGEDGLATNSITIDFRTSVDMAGYTLNSLYDGIDGNGESLTIIGNGYVVENVLFSGTDNDVYLEGFINAVNLDVEISDLSFGEIVANEFEPEIVKTPIEMLSGSNFSSTLTSVKSIATSIVFNASIDTDAYSAATYQYDVSAAQDGSVVAYMGSDNVLHIEANGYFEFASNSSTMFSNFSKVTSIDFGDNIIRTSGVTSMYQMFMHCSALTSLDLSDFTTSNVTTMASMFYYCKALISLDLSSFDTSSVTNFYGMFEGCSSLLELDLSNFDTSAVTAMDKMFYSCTSLTALDLSSFSSEELKSITYMFTNINQTLEVPVATSIMKAVFESSSSPGIGISFYVIGDTSGDVLSSIDEYYTYTYDSSTGGYQLGLTDKFKTAVNSTSGSFEDELGNIWTVGDALPNPGSTYGDYDVTSYASTFYNYYVMTSLDLSLWDTSNIINMSYMFYIYPAFSPKLETLNLSSFDTSSVVNMSYMFGYCKSLTTLDLSSFDTINVTTMSNMFRYCSSLISLDLSSFSVSTSTTTTYMFGNMTQTLAIPVANETVASIFDTSSSKGTNISFYVVTVEDNNDNDSSDISLYQIQVSGVLFSQITDSTITATNISITNSGLNDFSTIENMGYIAGRITNSNVTLKGIAISENSSTLTTGVTYETVFGDFLGTGLENLTLTDIWSVDLDNLTLTETIMLDMNQDGIVDTTDLTLLQNLTSVLDYSTVFADNFTNRDVAIIADRVYSSTISIEDLTSYYNQQVRDTDENSTASTLISYMYNTTGNWLAIEVKESSSITENSSALFDDMLSSSIAIEGLALSAYLDGTSFINNPISSSVSIDKFYVAAKEDGAINFNENSYSETAVSNGYISEGISLSSLNGSNLTSLTNDYMEYEDTFVSTLETNIPLGVDYYWTMGVSDYPCISAKIATTGLTGDNDGLASVAVGNSTTLKVYTVPAGAYDQSVTWTSMNTGTAVVSSDGVVTGVSVGTTTIVATHAEGATYTYTVTVYEAMLDFEFDNGTVEVSVGDTLYIPYTSTPQGVVASEYTYSISGDSSIISFNEDTFSVTGVAEGTVFIDFYFEGLPDDDYNGKVRTLVVTVIDNSSVWTGDMIEPRKIDGVYVITDANELAWLTQYDMELEEVEDYVLQEDIYIRFENSIDLNGSKMDQLFEFVDGNGYSVTIEGNGYTIKNGYFKNDVRENFGFIVANDLDVTINDLNFENNNSEFPLDYLEQYEGNPNMGIVFSEITDSVVTLTNVNVTNSTVSKTVQGGGYLGLIAGYVSYSQVYVYDSVLEGNTLIGNTDYVTSTEMIAGVAFGYVEGNMITDAMLWNDSTGSIYTEALDIFNNKITNSYSYRGAFIGYLENTSVVAIANNILYNTVGATGASTPDEGAGFLIGYVNQGKPFFLGFSFVSEEESLYKFTSGIGSWGDWGVTQIIMINTGYISIPESNTYESLSVWNTDIYSTTTTGYYNPSSIYERSADLMINNETFVSSLNSLEAVSDGSVVLWVYVENDYPLIKRVSIETTSDLEQEVTMGESISLDATLSPSTATVSAYRWSSSDTAIAVVDEDGNVTGIMPGTAIITYSSEDGASLSFTITVDYRTVENFEIEETEVEMEIGNTSEYTIVSVPTDLYSYEYSIDIVDANGYESSVVSVDKTTNTISANEVGTAYIYFNVYGLEDTDENLENESSRVIEVVVTEEYNILLDYYTYTYDSTTGGYKLGLTADFKTAVSSSNGTFEDSNAVIWNAGDPLPNPGSTYGDYDVTSYLNLFSGCYPSILNLSLWDTSNVKDMRYLFFAMDWGAVSIDMSSFTTESLTLTDGMFGCNSAGSYGQDLTVLVGSLEALYAFRDSSDLGKGVHFSLASEAITLEDYYVYTYNSYYGGYSLSLTEDFKKAVNSTNGIFEDTNGNVWNVGDPLPDPGSTYDGKLVISYIELFMGYSEMTSIDLCLWDTSNVKYFTMMFWGCTSLTDVIVIGFNTENATSMDGMFGDCQSLVSLDLSYFMATNMYITEGMFYECYNLTYLDMSRFTISDNVYNVDMMFEGTGANIPVYAGNTTVICPSATIDRLESLYPSIYFETPYW